MRGGRAERQLHALEQPHHGLGHHVGRAVPHDGERLGILLGEQPQANFAAGGQRAVQIDLPAVDFGQHGRLGQTRADRGRHVVGGDRPIELFPAAVGQNYGQHRWLSGT